METPTHNPTQPRCQRAGNKTAVSNLGFGNGRCGFIGRHHHILFCQLGGTVKHTFIILDALEQFGKVSLAESTTSASLVGCIETDRQTGAG
jgi:hypothetical protein